jgi:hypothetical protein
MRKTLAVAVVSGVVLALAACGIRSGVITERTYEESYTNQNCRWVTTGGGGKLPAQQTYQCQPIHEPERWGFWLSDDGDTGWVEVSRTTWDSYAVGDQYP